MHSIQSKTGRNLPAILALNIYHAVSSSSISTCRPNYTMKNHLLLFLVVQGKNRFPIGAAVLGIHVRPPSSQRHE